MRKAVTAVFVVSHSLTSEPCHVEVRLARPLRLPAVHPNADCEFETFQCRALAAEKLSGDLPPELERYRGWYIRDVRPGKTIEDPAPAGRDLVIRVPLWDPSGRKVLAHTNVLCPTPDAAAELDELLRHVGYVALQGGEPREQTLEEFRVRHPW